jgi:carbonic anhydrase/SulP family sulfate permease
MNNDNPSDYPATASGLHAANSPTEVLDLLMEGNKRFQSGTLAPHDYRSLINSTANGQNPVAIVLSCIDSRVPVEQVFDVSVGDIFSARVAGNVIGTTTLGSIEYAVGVSGVRLIVVLGHTRCGAATAAVEAVVKGHNPPQATECIHLPSIIEKMAPLIDKDQLANFEQSERAEQIAAVDEIAKKNVLASCESLSSRSPVIARLSGEGELKVTGAMYDVTSGTIELLSP